MNNFYDFVKSNQEDQYVQETIKRIDQKIKTDRRFLQSPIHLRGYFLVRDGKNFPVLSKRCLDFIARKVKPKVVSRAILEYLAIREKKFVDGKTSLDLNSTAQRILVLLEGVIYFYTYKESKRQCWMGTSRSANDLLRLHKYYFPEYDIELIDVMRALYKLGKENKIEGQYCLNIKKLVFNSYGNYVDESCRDEFGTRFGLWGSLFRSGKNYSEQTE